MWTGAHREGSLALWFPIEVHTGLNAGDVPVVGAGKGQRRSDPGGGAWARPVFSPKKGGDPVTYSPTVICEVVAP